MLWLCLVFIPFQQHQSALVQQPDSIATTQQVALATTQQQQVTMVTQQQPDTMVTTQQQPVSMVTPIQSQHQTLSQQLIQPQQTITLQQTQQPQAVSSVSLYLTSLLIYIFFFWFSETFLSGLQLQNAPSLKKKWIWLNHTGMAYAVSLHSLAMVLVNWINCEIVKGYFKSLKFCGC